jgi:phosphate-selective porin O/P
MKLSLFSAAPVLLLATSSAFAQAPAVAPAPLAAPAPAPAPAPPPPPAAVPDAPTTAAAPPAIDVTAPAPAPVPLATPAELLPPIVPEIPLATKLGIGKDGFWQPSALLQFWAFGANQGGDTTTTLRIRRAELRIKGEILPKLLGFNVMIDPARALDNNRGSLNVNGGGGGTVTANNQGTVTILQDFMVSFMSEYADLTVGQFKIPISYEGYNGSSKLLFPERAVVSRRFGDQRDLGIKLDKKLGKHFYYQAGVFNGEGQNKLDSNTQKDLALRLEVYPIDGIMIGGAGYMGATRRDSSPTKDRVEADFRLDLGNVLLQAEYIHGWDGPTNVARKESAGIYAALGYTIMEKVQPLFRIGHFDSDVRGNLAGNPNERGSTAPFSDEMTSYELGVNYFLRGHEAKLQAAWSRYVFPDQLNRGEFILAAQAAF